MTLKPETIAARLSEALDAMISKIISSGSDFTARHSMYVESLEMPFSWLGQLKTLRSDFKILPDSDAAIAIPLLENVFTEKIQFVESDLDLDESLKDVLTRKILSERHAMEIDKRAHDISKK